MSDRDAPKAPAKPTDREAKLAQALRANLRRRKVGAPPAPASKGDKSSPD